MPEAHAWLHEIIGSAHIAALGEGLRASGTSGGDIRGGRVQAHGSRGSSITLTAGALSLSLNRPIVLVVAHLDEADDALDDLALFNEAGRPIDAARFGALEVMPGESNVSLELLAERLSVVGRLVEKDVPDLILAPVQALMQAIPEPGALASFSRVIRTDADLPPGDLMDWLVAAGYQRQDVIEQPGDFASRGGILDIYPPAGSTTDTETDNQLLGPIRLDYFGDTVESIHRINPDTMGSAGQITSARIIGASTDQIQNDDRTVNLIDLLPDDTVFILHEVMELSEQARGYYERLTNAVGVYAPNTVFSKINARPHIECNQYSAGSNKKDTVTLPVGQLMTIDEDAKGAIRQLGELAQTSGQRVTVLCQKPAELERLSELIREHASDAINDIALEVGYLHRGFTWDTSGGDSGDTSGGVLNLVPHHELFHRYHVRRRVRRITGGAQVGDAFLDLDVGDYVVHVDHGIAKFTGIKTMRRGGMSQEYLTLAFAQSAVLHVPATQIDLVQKYVGGFEGRPPLSTLGGKRWGKQKQQVAEAVKDLAAELLRVQAARQTQPGTRYPGDTAWQREFEAEFPYDETEDQLAAIAAIKQDMGHDQPMDRLICGDVGFGKTEVAIRAAFKAVEFGKQVAVLVPTTVLAEQHGRTFAQRMADYPFKVASISRFKTGAEQTKLLKDLAAGKIDIVIGTHRLLSKDVQFADLGLVIIDEEQRFGVEHKNKLLRFRLTAEVLTLTATPIPRTLHMSMIGLRDISSLSTPPADRRAIVTEVVPYDRQRVKQAINRELNRDGQVFFVHNRVHNIQSVADEIKQLVPDARIIIGHGQMPSRELEKVMLTFMSREADVLVSTTIIESGIDNPTANTMFINRADNFGLADLHQLRGRVGRYKHRAYCYLLLPEDRPLTEVAARRLKAIEQYSMLGAGFKIAMRDLEIRGAGNLLGAEQSGHIAAVGYEMYCTLLEHAAKRLRHEPVIEPAKTHLELPVVGALPKRYIPSDKHRMEAYRRISRAATLNELDEVIQSIREAYGDAPKQAQTLINLTEVRIGASTLGIDTLKLEGPDLIFTTRDPRKLEAVFNNAPGRVSVLDETTLYYRPPSNYLDPPETLLAVLRKLLVRPVTAGSEQSVLRSG
jgi:transcription-repair coupling factor (superfamily II helicase)